MKAEPFHQEDKFPGNGNKWRQVCLYVIEIQCFVFCLIRWHSIGNILRERMRIDRDLFPIGTHRGPSGPWGLFHQMTNDEAKALHN